MLSVIRLYQYFLTKSFTLADFTKIYLMLHCHLILNTEVTAAFLMERWDLIFIAHFLLHIMLHFTCITLDDTLCNIFFLFLRNIIRTCFVFCRFQKFSPQFFLLSAHRVRY